LKDILVITGGAKEKVEQAISHLKVKAVYNRKFYKGEMLSSVQCGLHAITSQTEAVLVGLGDQPQVQAGSIKMVCEAYHESKSGIVVPSHQKRRGHPWLVARPLWEKVLKMEPPRSLRDFLNAHHEIIKYINVDDPGILDDLDTPEDYQRWQSQVP
jgi:molybdenum cofactor cytidylyltransferase